MFRKNFFFKKNTKQRGEKNCKRFFFCRFLFFHILFHPAPLHVSIRMNIYDEIGKHESPKTETVDCWLFLELRRSSLVRWTINGEDTMRRYFAVYGNELIRAGEVKQPVLEIFHFNGSFVSPLDFFFFDYRAVKVLNCVSCMKDAYIQLRTLAIPSRLGNWPLFYFISVLCWSAREIPTTIFGGFTLYTPINYKQTLSR
jgi:hypothetical protein